VSVCACEICTSPMLPTKEGSVNGFAGKRILGCAGVNFRGGEGVKTRKKKDIDFANVD